MRIHSLTLDNVRAIDHLELNDLPDEGVVVIHGPNERGKSTILESIGVILNSKYSTNATKIKELQPAGRDVPVTISLEASLGPHRFQLTKQFLRSKKAELKILTPRPEQHTGDDAENRLKEILSTHLDTELMNTLFMQQGELDAGISAAGIPSLRAALEGADTTSTDTEDTELFQRVKAEYNRYFTEKGQERGELKEARSLLIDAQSRHAAAQSQVAALEGHVDQVERLQESMKKDLNRLPEAEAEHASLKSKLEKANKAKESVEHAKSKQELVNAQVEALLKQQAYREELAEEAKSFEATIAKLSHERTELAEKSATEQDKLNALGEQLAQVRLIAQTTETALDEARRAQKLAEQFKRKTELETFFTELGDLDQQIKKASESLPEPTISTTQLKEIETAAQDLRIAEATAEAMGGKLTLRSSSPTNVDIQGEELSLEGSQQFPITGPFEFTVGTVTAIIEPGGDIEAPDPAELNKLLAKYSCTSLDEARTLHQTCASLSANLERLQLERKALVRGRDLDEERRELEQLADIESPTTVPDIDEAEAAQQEAKQNLALIETKIDVLRESKTTQNLLILDTRIEEATKNHQRALAALEESEDPDFEDNLASKQQEFAERTTALDEAQQELASADPDTTAELFAGAEAQLDGIQQRLRKTETEIARAESWIDNAQGAAEDLAQAESTLLAKQASFDTTERRANAAKMLYSSLIRHRDAARRKYAQPFSQRLEDLARSVFGSDVSFELSDDLSVSQRSVTDTTVPVSALSGGAKEQLAILARFAIADLVAPESGVPIFVDDALGATDEDRLKYMNTLFTRVGRENQVFVLTCIPSRYDRVVGRTEFAIDELMRPGE